MRDVTAPERISRIPTGAFPRPRSLATNGIPKIDHERLRKTRTGWTAGIRTVSLSPPATKCLPGEESLERTPVQGKTESRDDRDRSGEQPELSIVLPCLNEAETVGRCVRKARNSLDSLALGGEIIVADNGSTDGSQRIAESNGARVITVQRRGYGAALRAGISAARGKYVLMADADDSYALDDIGAFVDRLHEGHDLVLGNRFQGGIEHGAMPALHRYLGNPVLTRLGRLFFHIPVGDFHCGIRAFRRDRILGLGLHSSGMEFASEMVVRAALGGCRITEVPTSLHPDGRRRPPHLRTWRDGWRHLRFLLAFSPRWLLLYPGMLLLLTGLLGLLWLSFGVRHVAGVGFGLHSMLAFATMFVLGLQGVGLAVIARSYAAHLGLLPPPSGRFGAWITRVSHDSGITAGLTCLVLGVGCFAFALAMWGATGFGELDVVRTMRVPILGMVLLVAGFQLVTVSFVLGLSRFDED
ncbi:glycosyltransferase family 2 protein [Amycolatopsis thermoflava]|uniref:glycosyltransferase family 2 protein n=1 Tax=Amycolatopsis thermoflava TaxID=84480 RepID=UPI003EC11E77